MLKHYLLYFNIAKVLNSMDKKQDRIFESYNDVFKICTLVDEIMLKLPEVKEEIMNSEYGMSLTKEGEFSYSVSYFSEIPITEKTTYDITVLFTRDLYLLFTDIYKAKTAWYQYGDIKNDLNNNFLYALYQKFYMVILLAKAYLLGINIKGMINYEAVYQRDGV